VELEEVSCSEVDDKKKNEEVLAMVQENRRMVGDITERKKNWIGHVLRHECLLQEIIAGKCKGKRKKAGLGKEC